MWLISLFSEVYLWTNLLVKITLDLGKWQIYIIKFLAYFYLYHIEGNFSSTKKLGQIWWINSNLPKFFFRQKFWLLIVPFHDLLCCLKWKLVFVECISGNISNVSFTSCTQLFLLVPTCASYSTASLDVAMTLPVFPHRLFITAALHFYAKLKPTM